MSSADQSELKNNVVSDKRAEYKQKFAVLSATGYDVPHPEKADTLTLEELEREYQKCVKIARGDKAQDQLNIIDKFGELFIKMLAERQKSDPDASPFSFLFGGPPNKPEKEDETKDVTIKILHLHKFV